MGAISLMLGGVNNPLFFGAFAGFAILAIIIVPLLRWAFSTKKTGLGVPKRIGQPHDYGSLTPVGKPVSFIEGEVMRKIGNIRNALNLFCFYNLRNSIDNFLRTDQIRHFSNDDSPTL